MELEALKKEWLKNEMFTAEYEALKDEFEQARYLIQVQKNFDLRPTQNAFESTKLCEYKESI